MAELTPEQAQSKFQLTETLLPPAKCVFCGRSKQEAMVTGNLYIEFYGQVYICVNCAQEIAVVVEYGPVAELLLAQAELLARDEEIEALNVALEEEKENVRVLTRIASVGASTDDSGESVDSVVDTPEPEKPKQRTRAGKVVPPKSGDGSSESSAS